MTHIRIHSATNLTGVKTVFDAPIRITLSFDYSDSSVPIWTRMKSVEVAAPQLLEDGSFLIMESEMTLNEIGLRLCEATDHHTHCRA